MTYELPKLPYAYDALEPYIDTKTMEIHHTKHHQAYVNNLNAALEKHPEISDKSLESLISSPNTIPEDIRTAVKNHGGGHLNHSFFWKIMGPNPKKEPQGELSSRIISAFGDLSKFKEEFTKAAGGVFGSGWAWLVIDENGKLSISTTPNQDSPISRGQKPVLGLDVWEHAYYLKYQNKRPDYITAWWNVVDWEAVEKNFKNAL